MSTRWPVTARRSLPAVCTIERMHTRYVDGITIRPLRNGDIGTVSAVLGRLGPRSRAQRFGGPKPRVSERELAQLARVDAGGTRSSRWVDGDPEPAGLAQLVRDGASAEIAFAVADVHQGRGIGSVLARELAADALAAGITELVATVTGDNPRVVSLLRRVTGSVRETWLGGGQRELVLRLER